MTTLISNMQVYSVLWNKLFHSLGTRNIQHCARFCCALNHASHATFRKELGHKYIPIRRIIHQTYILSKLPPPCNMIVGNHMRSDAKFHNLDKDIIDKNSSKIDSLHDESLDNQEHDLLLTNSKHQQKSLSEIPIGENGEEQDLYVSEIVRSDVQDNVIDLPAKEKSEVSPIYNLAPLVNKSPVLKQLVQLGVSLPEVEKIDGTADMLIKLDFENDVQPHILFLKDIGVPSNDLGNYLSRNPMILKKAIPELQMKIHYLESKNFTDESIARIVSKSVVFLMMPVSMIDAKLGYLQNEFHLSGDEVRAVVTRFPKLLPWRKDKLKEIKLYIKEFLGFAEHEMKTMLLFQPKVFVTNKYSLGKKFDYLYNTMKIDHKAIAKWPNIFRSRLHIIQQRHGYLESIDRAQYNPDVECYVSLKALVSGTDQEFCSDVAKTPLPEYKNFLKTI